MTLSLERRGELQKRLAATRKLLVWLQNQDFKAAYTLIDGVDPYLAGSHGDHKL